MDHGVSSRPTGGSAEARTTIAVVTSNYNHARYLPESIESVVTQSVAPSEFVIVDDCSTDDSVAVIERYAREYPLITLVRRAKNRGGIANVNEAIRTLRSSHCISLAADDKLKPGFIAEATRLLNRYPQAGFCLCDYELFWDNGRRNERRMRLAPTDCYFPSTAVPRVLYDTWPHGQSVVRVAALHEAGGYREDLRWHCDWFTLWAICVRYGFCYTPTLGTALRISDSSYSGAGRRGMQQREVLQRVVNLVMAPENQWLRTPLRDANALSHFGTAILALLWNSPGGREFLTCQLVGTVIHHSAYNLACRLSPRSFKDWLKRFLWKQ